MKKSLLALAVLGAFAGVANAQSNVTIYGIVDAGLVREFGDGPDTTKLTSGVRNGSRLGFKGTEDLGGGLKAIFQLENGFNVDSGTQGQGALFGRQAYVGLSSNAFGSVTLGRQYAPIFNSLDSIDPFGTGLAGSATNLFATTVRVNNSVKYTSNNYAGFSGEVIYGFGETAGDTTAGRYAGVGLNYANGPITATFAHSNADAAAANKTKLSLIGGAYDFGVVKAHATFQVEKDSIDDLDARVYMIGASAPIGNGSVMASFIRRNDRTSFDQDADQVALGYVYNLSKRTNFYTSIARISNDNGAGFVVGNATEEGTTNKAFNIGVQHRF